MSFFVVSILLVFEKMAHSENNCQCSYHPKLVPHVATCNSTTQLLSRDSSAWISYNISTGNNSNSRSSRYLIYRYCPLDYCLPKYPNVEINLNIANGADAQCAHYRPGLLCGQCKPDRSLLYYFTLSIMFETLVPLACCHVHTNFYF